MQKILLTAGLMVSLVLSLMAQNNELKHGITFKKLFMDYQSQNGGEITDFQQYTHGWEIGYVKPLQDKLNLVLPLKVGVVRREDNLEDLRKAVVGLDAQVQYYLPKDSSVITPYFMGGLGAVTEFDGEFNVQVPLGFGLNFKVSDRTYVNYQSEYRIAFADDRNNLHHAIGFLHFMDRPAEDMMDKPMDTDMDGVIDSEDECPQLPGVVELMGCPDSDGDGVADKDDDCPDKAGMLAFGGCPDTDGDGIADNADDCPEMAGVRSNNGCPDNDSDDDGIPNSIDKCPNIAGTAANNGCPEEKKMDDRDGDGIPDKEDLCPDDAGSATADGCPDTDGDGIKDFEDRCPNKAGLKVYGGCPDTDGDGIDDSRDRCPNAAGPVSTGGCPEIKKEDKETLDIAMRAVEFDTGKASLKSSSYNVLNQISRILGRYPDYNLVISGHTDNTGKASSNQSLSERRARACYEYLNTQGIDISRMTYIGYGETRPIADNNTLSGRSLNRRVEFSLVPGK